MRREKEVRIASLRRDAWLQRLHEHAKECLCCQLDLDAIEELAGDPFAERLMTHVRKRCDRMRMCSPEDVAAALALRRQRKRES